MKLGPAAPIFRVAELGASVAYYREQLGFRVEWQRATIASVIRGDCCIFLCEGDQTTDRTWAWLGVSDVDVLHEELRGRGALIRQGPTNFDWALEMQITDPDGNVLRVGSEPRPDSPIGPWLDARGRFWHAQSDGDWTL